ncbi:hypothetical protein EMIT0P294_30386 [Pseudomonas sp. IT-P294]
MPYEMKGAFSNIQAEQVQDVHERSPQVSENPDKFRFSGVPILG